MEIAEHFESIRKVHNCLGAVTAGRIQTGSFYDNYNILLVVDAKLHVMNALTSHAMDNNSMFLASRIVSSGSFPEPKAIGPSETPCPYTFVGGDEFTAQDNYLRVSSAQNEELRRALRPADITLKVIFSRFGILREKYAPMGPEDFVKRGFLSDTVAAAVTLHNYLVQRSPVYMEGLMSDYTGIEEMLAQLKLSEPSTNAEVQRYQREMTPLVTEMMKKHHCPALKQIPTQSMPRNVKVSMVPPLTVKEDWREVLHMDKGTFNFLLSRCGPRLLQERYPDPEVSLSMVLRFLATGKGYTPNWEETFVGIFSILYETLGEYMHPVSVFNDNLGWIRSTN